MSDLTSFWLFTPTQLSQIHSLRNTHYFSLLQSKRRQLNTSQIDFCDRVLQRCYLRNLIKIVRSRKSGQVGQQFLMTEKILETAVHLFKRYYLVKDFINEEPPQVVLCAIYLATKLEEMREESIAMLAAKLKEKGYWRGMDPEPLHFNEEGYTDREMKFLETINFEVNKLSLIRPVQALLRRIEAIQPDVTKRLIIERQISRYIQNVYFSDLFWLVHPAKIAFSIVLCVIEGEKTHVEFSEIDKGGDLADVLEKNGKEIGELKEALRGLKPYNRKEGDQENKLEKYRTWTKYFFQKPTLRRMGTGGGGSTKDIGLG